MKYCYIFLYLKGYLEHGLEMNKFHQAIKACMLITYTPKYLIGVFCQYLIGLFCQYLIGLLSVYAYRIHAQTMLYLKELPTISQTLDVLEM